MKWLQENWLQMHLALAPLGTLAVTWLLWLSAGEGWQWWSSRDALGQMGQTAPWGAVIYGSIILVLERTGRMFWALAQREKDIEKGREEGRKEGRQEGREEGRQEGREEGRQEGREEGRTELIRQLVEQNVNLPPEILKEANGIDQSPPRS